jgi:hypothetical protein
MILPMSSSNVPDVSGVAYNILSQIETKVPLSLATILTYSTEVMQLVEKVTGLTGAQKLQVLIRVIGTIIQASALADPEKLALQELATTLLPVFASIVTEAAKGLLSINVENLSCCKGKCSML